MAKTHSSSELDKLYLEAEHVDKAIFAQMRSNLLLISGDHYNHHHASFFRRLRTHKDIHHHQKLRLTKNHVQNIVKKITNHITSGEPGVGFNPNNKNEQKDQKAAELNKSIWLHSKKLNFMDELQEDLADDFTGIGEMNVKIFFDPNEGEILAFQQKLDEKGEGMLDQEGREIGDPELPFRQGQMKIEQIHGFNLLRCPAAKKMSESPYLIYRKMADVDDLKKKFKVEDEDAAKRLTASVDETFIVFDLARRGFSKAARNQAMLREFYFRPGIRFPEGWFYITVRGLKLAEGPLPAGEFPIKTAAYDKLQTTPRGISPVKQMRPYQIEINRAASKMAEHQITLGDDKILIQNGSRVSAGVSLPGVRTINVSGLDPKIMPGRDGSQYLNYMLSQIEEMYRVMNIREIDADKKKPGDVQAMLFMSASRKKEFSRYVARYERFWVDVARTHQKLAKHHLPDQSIVRAIGDPEAINIAEFKASDDLDFQITIVPQVEDLETKFGKQLSINHLLQFIGPQLQRDDIGRLLRMMPFANEEQITDDFTRNYDNATNDILALDRGERPLVNEFDDHIYIINRLTSRMRQSDFPGLSDEIQQNYQLNLQLHQAMEVEKQEKIQAAKDGFIPSQGHLTGVDLFIQDPKDPSKSRKARLPVDSLNWLIQKLEVQGLSQARLEEVNQGALAQMSEMIVANRGAGTPPLGA